MPNTALGVQLFYHQGPSGTQLAGWALRDEFASDRCDFPNQLVIKPGFQVVQCLSVSARPFR